MIYLFERIPLNQSDDDSFEKLFSKLNFNINDMKNIDIIENSKNKFYHFYRNLLNDKNYIPEKFSIKSQQDYLHKTIDLLEVGIKANYNMNQKYSPFIKAKKSIVLGGDLISSLMTEYVFSRYVYSLGSIKFLKKKI